MIHEAREPIGDVPADTVGARLPAVEMAAAPYRVAYIINQYPKVSHTFIRREIQALERQGVAVDRISIRGWDNGVVDPLDVAELSRTRFVLKNGLFAIFAAALRKCLSTPRAFLGALRAAFTMSKRSERSLPYHLIYVAQACLVLEWLQESRANHLHAHFGTNPAEVAMLVRLLGGPPYSFTAHGAAETDHAEFLGLDKKVHYAKFVIGVSSFTRSQLLRRADVEDWPKIKVVHCGLNKEYFTGPFVPVPSAPKFVCVGRLSGEKGQLILVEAMQEIARKYPTAELVLAGDGEMRSVLSNRIQALGLQDRVKITGWLTGEQVRQEIQAARALIVPSFQEGLPIVIMEAMALKRPVIATHVSGIPELVQPGVTGWLVPAGSATDLADAMSACLATSPETLQQMADTAYARVSERHNIDREATKLAAFFKCHTIA